MTAKNRNFFLIIVLIIIVGGLFLTNTETGRNYAKWLESVFLTKLNIFRAGVSPTLPSEESGLEVSEVNLERLITETESSETPGASKISETPEIFESQELEREESVEQEVSKEEEKKIVLKPKVKKMTLEEIEKEVNKVAQEVKRIEREVKKLETLIAIQGEINEIAERISELNQTVAELRGTLT